jgi:protein-S-isoprenylcysteine O-methyltransferase Ste14
MTPVGFLAVFSAPHVPPNSWAELGFAMIGWGLFLTGALSRWWATLYIGGRKGNRLIQEGPYSISRNPLYFGTFLIVLSIAAMIQSLSFAIAAVASSVLYLLLTIPREERRLLQCFGETYASYRQRVPAFFPRMWLYRSVDEIVVRKDGLRAEFLRSLQWIWVPFICHFVVHLRTQSWWPHFFRMP